MSKKGWRWRRRERGSRKTWRYEYLTFKFLALKWQAMKEALQVSKYERVWEDLQPTFRREFVKISPGPKFGSDVKRFGTCLSNNSFQSYWGLG